uniref:protein-histidine N-methyltransferase n=1 Tax=Romanomermis culicivorax TaxID=13658 RepID=A0A915JXA9_ROMCU
MVEELSTIRFSDSVQFSYYKPSFISESVKKKSPELFALLKTSDLLPGEYEGGLKIWECSIDLGRYISRLDSKVKLANKNVVELGCGAGIPGLASLLSNANRVVFQDYNKEVLDLWTRPNVELMRKVGKCSFYACDWENISQVISEKFDIILSSETIYCPSSYEKLFKAISTLLKQDGIALVAAKSYYFGVGGSVSGFSDYVKNEKSLIGEVIWTSENSCVPRHI